MSEEDVVDYEMVFRYIGDVSLALDECYSCLYDKIAEAFSNNLRLDFKKCGKCKMKILCKILYEVFLDGYEWGARQ